MVKTKDHSPMTLSPNQCRLLALAAEHFTNEATTLRDLTEDPSAESAVRALRISKGYLSTATRYEETAALLQQLLTEKPPLYVIDCGSGSLNLQTLQEAAETAFASFAE